MAYGYEHFIRQNILQLFLNCRYVECVSYFCVKPKSSEREVAPKDFFGLWTSFCHEFKELWKTEQRRVCQERSAMFYPCFAKP